MSLYLSTCARFAVLVVGATVAVVVAAAAAAVVVVFPFL